MKFVALLLFAAASLSNTAFAHGGTIESSQKKAVVAFEVIDTANNTNTVLSKSEISAPIDNAVIFTPVSASDFSQPLTDKAAVSITQERPYLVHSFKPTGVGAKGENEIKAKAVEGTRARARVSQVGNAALSGVLILDIRQIVAIRNFDNGEVSAELPDIRQNTFSVPLREGTQSVQVGQYKVNTTVSRQEVKNSTKHKRRYIGKATDSAKASKKAVARLENNLKKR